MTYNIVIDVVDGILRARILDHDPDFDPDWTLDIEGYPVNVWLDFYYEDTDPSELEDLVWATIMLRTE